MIHGVRFFHNIICLVETADNNSFPVQLHTQLTCEIRVCSWPRVFGAVIVVPDNGSGSSCTSTLLVAVVRVIIRKLVLVIEGQRNLTSRKTTQVNGTARRQSTPITAALAGQRVVTHGQRGNACIPRDLDEHSCRRRHPLTSVTVAHESVPVAFALARQRSSLQSASSRPEWYKHADKDATTTSPVKDDRAWTDDINTTHTYLASWIQRAVNNCNKVSIPDVVRRIDRSGLRFGCLALGNERKSQAS